MTYSANDNSPAQTRFAAQLAADILVRDYGTMWSFSGQSEAGAEYLRDELGTESWQWSGPLLMVDHRPARQLLEHIEDGTSLDVFLV